MNQRTVYSYFFSYYVDGTFQNTVVQDLPAVLSPNDFHRIECEIHRNQNWQDIPVIINFQRLG